MNEWKLATPEIMGLAQTSHVVGGGVLDFVPWLGAIGNIAGGLLGGGEKKADTTTPMMQMMMLQQQKRDKEAKEAEKKAAARNQMILYSVFGVLGLAVVGGGLYFAMKK